MCNSGSQPKTKGGQKPPIQFQKMTDPNGSLFLSAMQSCIIACGSHCQRHRSNSLPWKNSIRLSLDQADDDVLFIVNCTLFDSSFNRQRLIY